MQTIYKPHISNKDGGSQLQQAAHFNHGGVQPPNYFAVPSDSIYFTVILNQYQLSNRQLSFLESKVKRGLNIEF